MTSAISDVPDQDLREQAAQHTLAANPLVGVRGRDIAESAHVLIAHMLRNPGVAARQYLSFLGELGRIATGSSELAPSPGDSVPGRTAAPASCGSPITQSYSPMPEEPSS